MKRKTIIITGLVLFALGIATAGFVYKFIYNKPHPDFEKARPEFIISATDLFDKYTGSRSVAESKYNGTMILLTGKLDKIEHTDDMTTAIFVFEQGMFGDEGIRCVMLPHHAQSLKTYQEGSEIQLKGYLTGYNGTDVIMEKCSVVR